MIISRRFLLVLVILFLMVIFALFNWHLAEYPTDDRYSNEEREVVQNLFYPVRISSHPVTISSHPVTQIEPDLTLVTQSEPEPILSTTSSTLSPEIINGIKKFVFFIGTGRSGHSIVGSLLDAHPHIVIPDQFLLFHKWSLLGDAEDPNWTTNLFDKLYRTSANDAVRRRTWSAKGYTLGVDGQWQGTFDQYIEVIGDKSGGVTTGEYRHNRTAFIEKFKVLKEKLPVPIRIFHVVRNPFDIISTILLYNTPESDALQQYRFNKTVKLNKLSDLYSTIGRYFKFFEVVMEMTEKVFREEKILVLHNSDLINDPRGTMLKACNFLEVEVSENYLDSCAGKVFKSVSRSRDKVLWTKHLIARVEEKMRVYPIFDRYSFTSD